MRTKKSKIVIPMIIIIFIFLLACIAIIFYGKKQMDLKNDTIQAMQTEMNENKQIVYVTSVDVKKGDTLEIDKNVMTQEIYTGLEAANYITEEELGSVATVDILAGLPVMVNMITDLTIENDTREYELSVVNLMTDQTEFDYVDVRIMFPNGEDYLVLSKKPVKNLVLESCLFFTYLNEEEILRMASATIDAYTITGTRIYTTRYVESNLQETATPNYLVKAETIDLLNSDPNILTLAKTTVNLAARMDLENRLRGLTEEQLTAVSAGHGLTDTAQSSVILKNKEAVDGQMLDENGNPIPQDPQVPQEGAVVDPAAQTGMSSTSTTIPSPQEQPQPKKVTQ